MSITQRRRFFLWQCLYSVCITIFPSTLAGYALLCRGRVLYSCALVVAVFFFIPYLSERAGLLFLGAFFFHSLFHFRRGGGGVPVYYPPEPLSINWFSLFPGALDGFLFFPFIFIFYDCALEHAYIDCCLLSCFSLHTFLSSRRLFLFTYFFGGPYSSMPGRRSFFFFLLSFGAYNLFLA